MEKNFLLAIYLDITPIFSGKYCTKVEDVLKSRKLIQMEKNDVHLGGTIGNT